MNRGILVLKPTRWIAAALALAVVALLAAVPVTSAQSANAMVRVAHASPDAPAVDVYVDGSRVLANVPFPAVSSYLNVPGGQHAIKVLPAGAPAANKGVIEANVTVEGGKAYTIAAAGKVAEIGPVVLSDNLTTPAAGKAHVRFVHLSPDAPAVDVAVKGGPVLFPNTAFKGATSYAPVDAGSYDLEVRPAGQPAVALAVPGVRLEAGVSYTVFAMGLLQGQPNLRAVAVVDARAGMVGMPRTGAGGMAAPMVNWSIVALALGLGGVVAGGLLLRRRIARG